MKMVQLAQDNKEVWDYQDVDVIHSVRVESYFEPNSNLKLEKHFRAVGTDELGMKHVLTYDSGSDKPDKVIQWVTSNILKR